MAAVTPQLIKELRELTGAGMMDCKNALNRSSASLSSGFLSGWNLTANFRYDFLISSIVALSSISSIL